MSISLLDLDLTLLDPLKRRERQDMSDSYEARLESEANESEIEYLEGEERTDCHEGQDPETCHPEGGGGGRTVPKVAGFKQTPVHPHEKAVVEHLAKAGLSFQSHSEGHYSAGGAAATAKKGLGSRQSHEIQFGKSSVTVKIPYTSHVAKIKVNKTDEPRHIAAKIVKARRQLAKNNKLALTGTKVHIGGDGNFTKESDNRDYEKKK